MKRFLIWLVGTIISFPVGGYVFSMLWLWFIVPLHVLSISISQGIGMMLLLRLITYDYSKNDNKRKSDKEFITEVISGAITIPLAFLAFGYILHLFM